MANDLVNELSAVDPLTGELLWTMTVPNAHELIVTRNGKTAYVSGRAGNALHVVDLQRQEIVRTTAVGPLPDSLRLSANEKLLTVGLRGTPAQVAIVDTETFDYDSVTIGGTGTIAGHQWTSPNGHFTFAAFEGPGAGVAVIDHERNDRSSRRSTIPAGRMESTSPIHDERVGLSSATLCGSAASRGGRRSPPRLRAVPAGNTMETKGGKPRQNSREGLPSNCRRLRAVSDQRQPAATSRGTW